MIGHFDPNEVYRAARRIAPYVRKSPLVELTSWPLLLKAESLHPTGSFKIRGAFNSLLSLTPDQRACGVIAHSSGNHALAVSYAASRLGIHSTIVMPRNAPRVKIEGTRRHGAKVVLVGPSSAERTADADELARSKGYIPIPPYDASEIIAATGVIAVEMLDERPDTQLVLAPISGGGLMAGIAAMLKHLKPAVRVIGVEPESAADAAASFVAGHPVCLPAEQMSRTIADGLRVQQVGNLNWPLIRDCVDEIVTVSEDAIRQAMRDIPREGHLIAEPSGAVAAAGARVHGLASLQSVAVLTGGNVDMQLLTETLSSGGVETSRCVIG